MIAIRCYARFVALGPHQFVFVNRTHADLMDPVATRKLLFNTRPTRIIHLAAKIAAMETMSHNHAEYYMANQAINTNMLQARQLSTSFGAVFPHLPALPPPLPPYAPCDLLYLDVVLPCCRGRMLIGACNLMLCPLHVLQASAALAKSGLLGAADGNATLLQVTSCLSSAMLPSGAGVDSEVTEADLSVLFKGPRGPIHPIAAGYGTAKLQQLQMSSWLTKETPGLTAVNLMPSNIFGPATECAADGPLVNALIVFLTWGFFPPVVLGHFLAAFLLRISSRCLHTPHAMSSPWPHGSHILIDACDPTVCPLCLFRPRRLPQRRPAPRWWSSAAASRSGKCCSRSTLPRCSYGRWNTIPMPTCRSSSRARSTRCRRWPSSQRRPSGLPARSPTTRARRTGRCDGPRRRRSSRRSCHA